MNILIADDEQIIREGITSLDWHSIGIEQVYSAQNGLVAKEILEKEQVDLAIFDIRMPGITGIELAKYIYDNEMDISIIFLTGYAEFEYAKKAITYGVSEYIVKPFKPRELICVVEELIQKKQRLFQEKFGTGSDSSKGRKISVQIRSCFEEIDDTSKRMIYKMAEQYQTDLSLDEFAVQYHFTPQYLSRKIKQDTGYTFVELVKAIRLSYAMKDIFDGMKISDACYHAGFQDQGYFSQVFKSIFDYPPSELKNRTSECPSFQDVLQCLDSKNKQKKRDEKK